MLFGRWFYTEMAPKGGYRHTVRVSNACRVPRGTALSLNLGLN